MKKISSNKKGGMVDVIIYPIMVFILIMFGGLLFFANDKVANEVTDAFTSKIDNLETNQTIKDISNDISTMNVTLTWTTAFLMIGIILAIFIGNYLTRTHPVFFIFYVLFVVVAYFIAIPISNAYETLYNNPDLVGSFSKFGGATFLLSNLPTIVIIVGLFGGLFLYINMGRDKNITGF